MTEPLPYSDGARKAGDKEGSMNFDEETLAAKLKENPDLKIEVARISVKDVPVWKTPKPSKYRAKRTEYAGVLFDSKKEAEFAQKLDLLIKAGDIDFYLRQVSFPLPGKSSHRIDFVTFKTKAPRSLGQVWAIHFLEIKGRDLPMGKLKRRQVEQLFGIHVEVI